MILKKCTVATLMTELEKCPFDAKVWVQTAWDSDSDDVVLELFDDTVVELRGMLHDPR